MANLTEIFDEDGNSLLKIDALISLEDTSRSSVTKYSVETGSVITENVSKDNLIVSLQGVISKATPIAGLGNQVVVNESVTPDADGARSVTVKESRESPLTLRSLRNRDFGGTVNKVKVSHSGGDTTREYGVKIEGKIADENTYKSSYVQDARKSLQQVMDKKLLVELVNASNAYPRLVMINLSFRKDAQVGGDALRFDAKFEQITYATSEITKKNTTPSSVDPTTPEGKKAVELASQSEVDNLCSEGNTLRNFICRATRS